MHNKTTVIMASAIAAILFTMTTVMANHAFAATSPSSTCNGICAGAGGAGGNGNGNGNTAVNVKTSHEGVNQIVGVGNGDGGNGGNALCFKAGCNGIGNGNGKSG
jgi:hypothetical protein